MKENDRNDEFADNIFTQAVDFLDKNLRLMKNVPYGLAAVVIAVYWRKFHVTKRFVDPRVIPQHFIDTNINLKGLVVKCKDNGHLQVRHIPMLQFKWLKPNTEDQGSLTLRFAGLRHTADSMLWLQENLENKKIWFSVVGINDQINGLDCFVYCKLGRFWTYGIHELLVKKGLAEVHFDKELAKHKLYNKKLEKMLALEIKADKKGVGMWERPTFTQRIAIYWGEKYRKFRNMFKRK